MHSKVVSDCDRLLKPVLFFLWAFLLRAGACVLGQYPQGQGLGGPQPGGYGGQDMAPVYQQQQHGGPPRTDSQLISFDWLID